MNETKLAFIGSGTMAEAMIKVILDKALIPPKQIILEKGGLRTILSKAIWAAYQKSLLLGEQNSITSPERELPLDES